MLVHSVVPKAGQERPGERLDFFVNCRCRMEAWQALFAQLDIAAEIRPITVIRACPDSQALQDTKWRTVAQHPACGDCKAWQAQWLGLFLPDATPSDIRPLAAARGIDMDIHVQSCETCPLAQDVRENERAIRHSSEKRPLKRPLIVRYPVLCRMDDELHTTFEDVEKIAAEFGRVALHLPDYHQVIVLDATTIGDGFVKQFDDTPFGMTQARRWAVRMEASDEISEQPFEELRAAYLAEIEGEQAGTCAAEPE